MMILMAMLNMNDLIKIQEAVMELVKIFHQKSVIKDNEGNILKTFDSDDGCDFCEGTGKDYKGNDCNFCHGPGKIG